MQLGNEKLKEDVLLEGPLGARHGAVSGPVGRGRVRGSRGGGNGAHEQGEDSGSGKDVDVHAVREDKDHVGSDGGFRNPGVTVQTDAADLLARELVAEDVGLL